MANEQIDKLKVRRGFLIDEAAEFGLDNIRLDIFLDLFMIRFPDEKLNITSYRYEWANRIKREDFGLGAADSETSKIIIPHLKPLFCALLESGTFNQKVEDYARDKLSMLTVDEWRESEAEARIELRG